MTPGLAPWWQGMDARHKAGHDEQEIRRLTAFRFVTIFLSAFPAEGRIHEASLVRGKAGACCRASQRGTGTARGPASGYYEPARGAR